MVFTRKEATELARRREVKRAEERRPQILALAQAEVASKQLTSSPAWNWYVQILSKLKENAEQALAAIDEQARTSEDFSHATLAHRQAVRRAWDMRIQTLDEVMALPAEIVDHSEKAKERLEALNHAESQEKSPGPAAS